MPPCTWIDVSQTVRPNARSRSWRPGRPRWPRRREFVDGPRRMAQHADRTLDQRQALGQQVRDRLVRADRSRRTARAPWRTRWPARRVPRAAPDQVGGRRVSASACQRPASSSESSPTSSGDYGVTRSDRLPQVAVLVRRRTEVTARRTRGVDASAPRSSRPDRSERGEIVGEHRAEERHVDQAAGELLGDDRDLDARRLVGAQRPPSGRVDRLLQPRDRGSSSSRSATDPGPRSSASLAAASRSWRCSAGQTNVHSCSFSTRRNTLPEGSRGISSTNTTRRGRLYDASRSPTSATSSSASTAPCGARPRRRSPRRRRRRAPRTPHSPRRPDGRAARPRSRRAPPGIHAP